MSSQNPGGEVVTKPTMKGCEFGMKKGKGSDTGGTLQTRYSTNAPGMSGMGKGGHKQKTSHVLSSISGATVTGTSKACRQ